MLFFISGSVMAAFSVFNGTNALLFRMCRGKLHKGEEEVVEKVCILRVQRFGGREFRVFAIFCPRKDNFDFEVTHEILIGIQKMTESRHENLKI